MNKILAITHSKGVQQKGGKKISRYSLYIVHMPFLCNLCRQKDLLVFHEVQVYGVATLSPSGRLCHH